MIRLRDGHTTTHPDRRKHWGGGDPLEGCGTIQDDDGSVLVDGSGSDGNCQTADEWYSPYMRFFGIGKKNYVRAGHAALVLIHKATGMLEYHDFGRYITPEPNGRVRGKKHDRELDFPLQAEIVGGKIQNLNELLLLLASNPKLTHGDGKLIASVAQEGLMRPKIKKT